MNSRRSFSFLALGVASVAVAILAVALAVARPGDPLALWTMFASGALAMATGVFAFRSAADIREELGRWKSEVDLAQSKHELSNAMMESLTDGMDLVLFVCDPKCRVLYGNVNARKVFRFEEPAGHSLLAVTLSSELEQTVLSAVATKEPMTTEAHLAHPEERTGIAKAWCSPDGSRVFLSVYDITDLRRLERIRRDFVSNVSHELRTPLAVVRAMAETLLDDCPDAEVRERYLGKIVEEVDRLTNVASDLLTLSTAESTEPATTEVDLAMVLSSVCEQLENKARENGVELTYEGPEHLTAPGNVGQLTQVAVNLVDNAVNYTSQGSIRVALQSDAAFAIFRVIDTGIGIPIDEQPRIFERFYRVDAGRSRAQGGTGLGLSIVKHMVEAHGGDVSVESQLNEGSTFTVRLPLARS